MKTVKYAVWPEHAVELKCHCNVAVHKAHSTLASPETGVRHTAHLLIIPTRRPAPHASAEARHLPIAPPSKLQAAELAEDTTGITF